MNFEDLKEYSKSNSVLNTIEHALSKMPKMPVNSPHPKISRHADSDEVFEYAKELKIWEEKNEKYHKEKKLWKEQCRLQYEAIEKFIKYQAGLDSVPEQYRDKLYSKAWSDGHSDGYSEVFVKLYDLVDIFN